MGLLSLAGVGMALTRSTSGTKDRILSVTCIHTPMDIFDNPHTRFRLLLSGILHRIYRVISLSQIALRHSGSAPCGELVHGAGRLLDCLVGILKLISSSGNNMIHARAYGYGKQAQVSLVLRTIMLSTLLCSLLPRLMFDWFVMVGLKVCSAGSELAELTLQDVDVTALDVPDDLVSVFPIG